MSTSTLNNQFTLTSSTGRHFLLSISEALHSLTLACLIPSQTYRCVLPDVCSDHAINFCVRYLKLVHNLSTSMDHGSLQSQPSRDLNNLVQELAQELEYNQIPSALSASRCLRLDELQIQRWLNERRIQLETNMTTNEKALMVEQFRKECALLSQSDHTIKLVSSDSCRDSLMLSSSMSEQMIEQPTFSLISKERHMHQVPMSVARWSPKLNLLIASGVDTLTLPECDDWSIRLATQFLRLLTIIPLVFHNAPTAVSSPFASSVPSPYAQLFDDEIHPNDGSDDRLYQICNALELNAMRLVVSLKVCRVYLPETTRANWETFATMRR